MNQSGVVHVKKMTRSNSPAKSPANFSASSLLAASAKYLLGFNNYLITKSLSAVSLLDFGFGLELYGNSP